MRWQIQVSSSCKHTAECRARADDVTGQESASKEEAAQEAADVTPRKETV